MVSVKTGSASQPITSAQRFKESLCDIISARPLLKAWCCAFFHSSLQQAQAMSVSDATPINQWAANVTNGLIREVIPAKQAFDMVGPPGF